MFKRSRKVIFPKKKEKHFSVAGVTSSKKRRELHKKKKYFILAFFLFGVLPMACLGIALRISQIQPLYVSPLPLTAEKKIMAPNTEDADRKKIEKILYLKGIPFTKLDITSPEGYIVDIKQNGKVLLSKEKEITEQASSLQVILIRLTMEGKRFEKLDMRFDRPVITLRK